MELIEHRCKRCGGELKNIGEGRWSCPYCSCVYDEAVVQKNTKSLHEEFDEVKREIVCNLRRNLYDAVNEEYISSEKVRECAAELKKYLPSDFAACFYEVAVSNNVKQLTKHIRRINVEENYSEIECIVRFLIRSLQTECLLELNNLVVRAYENKDSALFGKLMREISVVADKVQKGVYETKLPRAVFIAYSSKDMDKVSELCEYLESQGLECFVAARNLPHGLGAVERYNKALEEAMENCRSIVFVSSMNSRSFSCDALTIELAYVKTRDIAIAPAEYAHNYKSIPYKYKKPRVEYRIEDSRVKNTADMISNEFFDGYERVYSPEDVAERLASQLFAKPVTVEPEKQQEDKKVKYCVECFAEVPDDFRFCMECGGKQFAETKKEAELLRKIATLENDEKREASSIALPVTTSTQEVDSVPAEKSKFAVKSSEGLEFKLNEDGTSYSVIGIGDCVDEHVIIPEMYEGLPVTKIAEDTFYNCDVMEVTIPDSIISIDCDAFINCFNLSRVTIGDGVTKIAATTFSECENLTEVKIGKSVTRIDNYVFSGCINLVSITVDKHNSSFKSIDGNLYTKNGEILLQYAIGKKADSFVIPNTVEIISPKTFSNCISLKKVTIPNTVKNIGQRAFSWCQNITSLTISSNVSNIDDEAFGFCCNLQAINVDPNNLNYKSIDGNLYSKDGKTLLQYAVGHVRTEFTIPNEVTKIGQCAFAGCRSLTRVTIPNNVVNIGSDAFFGCVNLIDMVVPDSVVSIGDSLFCGCENLTDVTLGSGLTSIARFAFQGCQKLTSVTISDSVKHIYGHVFGGCHELKTIYYTSSQADWEKIEIESVIPESVKIICGSTISAVSDLSANGLYFSINEDKKSYSVTDVGDSKNVVIPSNYCGMPVTRIGEWAFSACKSLTSVVIPESVVIIDDFAFKGCENLTDIAMPKTMEIIGTEVFSGCKCLTNMTIPSGVEMGHWVFSNCSSLVSVTISDGVTHIAQGTFDGCSNLMNVVIPDSVTTIYNFAFANCTALESVTIPNNIREVGYQVFKGCRGLNAVVFNNPNGWQKKGGGMFSKISSKELLEPGKAAEALKKKYVNDRIERI